MLAALAVALWWLAARPDAGDGGAGADAGAGAAAGADGGAAEPGWRVTEVVDGDTVDVVRDGVAETVRLLGIDTPERGDCGYAEATALMTDLVTGRDVTLVEGNRDDRDRYGRLLRYLEVTVAGETVDVGLRQLEAGLAAEVYDSRTGYPPHDREDAYIDADDAAPDVCPDLREH